MANDPSIIFQRSPHDKEHPYAMISRSLIRDMSISPECRWLLIYLLSMRDDFKINIKNIWNHVNAHMGRDKIYKLINEACEAGYMMREVKFISNIKKQTIYYISEEKNEEFKKFFRRPDPQDPENQDILRITLTSSNEEDIKKECIEPPAPPPPLLSLGNHVKIKKEAYEKLCSDNGKEVVDDVIDTLNNKIDDGSAPKSKDYAATLRNWVKIQKKWGDKPKKSSFPSTSNSSTHVEKNQELAKKVVDTFPSKVKSNEIFLGNSYIEFVNGPHATHIKFCDNGFRDQVLNALRKRGWPLDGL